MEPIVDKEGYLSEEEEEVLLAEANDGFKKAIAH